MPADNDIQCAPAPAPSASADSDKTMKVAALADEPSKLRRNLTISAVFGLALIAGVVYTMTKARATDGAAAVSSEAAPADEGSGKVSVKTADPPECAGEVTDPQLRWYCTEFLPFARKAAADHDRLDRLEATGTDGGGSEVPMALWVVVAFIGVLTVYNTVTIHKKKAGKPTDG